MNVTFNRNANRGARGARGKRSGPQRGGRGYSNANANTRREFQEVDKQNGSTVEKTDLQEEDAEEEIDCLICTEVIEEWEVGECNHREICATCSLRLRQLYKDLNCPVCKKRSPEVVHTRDKKKKYEEFDLKKLTFDSSLQTYFEFHEDWAKVRKLWELPCPLCNESDASATSSATTPSTSETSSSTLTPTTGELSATSVPVSVFKKREVVFSSIKELKNHVKGQHGVRYCDLCIDFRKVFLHEQKLYTSKELTHHMDNGDPDNPEIKAHHYCQFCNFYLYGIDELYDHMQKNHETCHICTREGVQNQYFRDYQNLEKHFSRSHYLCPDRKCLENKFVVFPSVIDLRAHEVQVHGGNMSRAEKKKKSTLDPSLVFSLPPRGAERRREEPTTATTTTNSSNSIRTSGANSSSTVHSSSPSLSSSSSLPSTTTRSSSPSSLPSALKFDPPPTNPEEIKRRNQALINRVKTELENEEKFSEFKKLSADFRNESLTPAQYVQKFLSFFHHSPEAREIFKELITLLPDPVKKAALIKLSEPPIWQENLGKVRREEKEKEKERKEKEEGEKKDKEKNYTKEKGKKNLAQSQPAGHIAQSPGIWRGSGLSQSDQAFPPLPATHNHNNRTGGGHQAAGRGSAASNNPNVWENSQEPPDSFPALPKKEKKTSVSSADDWDSNQYDYDDRDSQWDEEEDGYAYAHSGSSNGSEYSSSFNLSNLSNNSSQPAGRGGRQSKKKQVLIKFG